jgi:hypothetical protein
MPTIEITNADFARLQKLATPFIDTPATTLERVLDFYEANGADTASAHEQSLVPSSEYNERNIPPLTHTKLLDATFGDLTPEKMTWDSLVRLALETVLQKVGSARELYSVSGANVVEGKKEVNGYKFVPNRNFSYQGVPAEDAVKIVARCARHLGIEARIKFDWRNKEGAYRPGEQASLKLKA